jgi:hypothetical protein
MLISRWAKQTAIPVLRQGKHFTLDTQHGAKTLMLPTETLVTTIADRVLQADIGAATAFLPAKRFKPQQYPFREVLEPFFAKTMLQLKQYIDDTGLAQQHFPLNNTKYYRFVDGVKGLQGFSKSGVSFWHQDGARSPGTSVVGLLYGPKKHIPLDKANLELALGNPDVARLFKQPDLPLLALPRRHEDDTAMAIVNNTQIFHRGTKFDFSNNPEAYRKHGRIFIGG